MLSFPSWIFLKKIFLFKLFQGKNTFYLYDYNFRGFYLG